MTYHEPPDPRTNKAPDHQATALKKSRSSISNTEIIPMVVDELDTDVTFVSKALRARNPITEIQNIRENRYSDRLAFLREAFQNVARSAGNVPATVSITISPTTLSISDNAGGVTKSNIDDVFILGESGWSKEVKGEQNPFGQGFMSAVIIFNKITVESNNVKAEFDWGKIEQEYKKSNTYDLSHAYVVLEAKSRDKFGRNRFKVTLENPTEYWDPEAAATIIKDTGGTFGFKELTINDVPITLHSFSSVPAGYLKVYKPGSIEGYIAPATLDISPTIHYFGAKVGTQHTPLKALTGSINVTNPRYGKPTENRNMWQESTKNSGIILTENLIRNTAVSIALTLVKDASDAQIKTNEAFITEYADYSDYKKHIRFKLINNGMIKQIEEKIRSTNPTISESEFKQEMDKALTSQSTLMDAASNSTLSKEESVQSYNQKQSEIQQKRSEIQQKQADSDSIEKEVLSQESEALDDQESQLRQKQHDSLTNKQRLTSLIDKNNSGSKLSDISRTTFWVPSDEITYYEEQIKKAEYHNYAVAIAHNKLQKELFQTESSKFTHISRFSFSQSNSAKLKSIGPKNAEERRIQFIINTFISSSPYSQIKVHIATFTLENTLTIPNTKIKEVQTIEAAAYAEGNNIYIERNINYGHSTDGAIDGYYGIKTLKPYLAYNDFPLTSKTIGWGDITLFLKLLPLLAHELAHAHYHTEDNTQSHLEAMTTIMAEFNTIIAAHQAKTQLSTTTPPSISKSLSIPPSTPVAVTYWEGTDFTIEKESAKAPSSPTTPPLSVEDYVITPTGNITQVYFIDQDKYSVYDITTDSKAQYSAHELTPAPLTPGRFYHHNSSLVLFTRYWQGKPQGITYTSSSPSSILQSDLYDYSTISSEYSQYTPLTKREQSTLVKSIVVETMGILNERSKSFSVDEVHTYMNNHIPVKRYTINDIVSAYHKNGTLTRLPEKYKNKFMYKF